MIVFTRVAVPRKGRDSERSIKRAASDPGEWDEILDIVNGKGKEAAKNGSTSEIKQELAGEYPREVEFVNTGRPGERPVINRLEGDKIIEGYALDENPFAAGYDQVWITYDQVGELYLSIDGRSQFDSLKEYAKEFASVFGYELTGDIEPSIKWSPMNTELPGAPDTVLIPSDFQDLAGVVAEDYWGDDLDFRIYNSSMDEEKQIARAPDTVAGIYMYNSGDTADDNGIEYLEDAPLESRLARFARGKKSLNPLEKQRKDR